MTRRPWLLLAVPLVAVNAVLLGVQLRSLLEGDAGADWYTLSHAAERVWSGGELYARDNLYGYQWSPVFAMAFGPVAWAGLLVWRLVHLAAILTLPDRRMTLLALVSWPFWFDLALGNVLTFVLWFAAWALAGKRWAVVGLFALALLVPRPIVVPLVAWFLWKQPWTRTWFAGLFAAHAALVLASGWGPEWMARMLSLSSEMTSIFNFGPSRVIGAAWFPFAIALSAVAFWKGRPALSGFLLSPYWLPYYFLVPLAELAQPHEARVVRGVPGVRPEHPDGQQRRAVLRHDRPEVLR